MQKRGFSFKERGGSIIKTILILDMSLIFPSMRMYEKEVLKQEINMSNVFSFPEFFNAGADLRTYRQMTVFLTRYLNQTHIPIYFYNQGINIPFQSNETYNILNFSQFSYFDDYYQFTSVPICNRYLWINNNTSRVSNRLNNVAEHVQICNTFEYDWTDAPAVDAIYLIFSHDLIPPVYRNLYDLWGSLFMQTRKQTITVKDSNTVHLLIE